MIMDLTDLIGRCSLTELKHLRECVDEVISNKSKTNKVFKKREFDLNTLIDNSSIKYQKKRKRIS